MKNDDNQIPLPLFFPPLLIPLDHWRGPTGSGRPGVPCGGFLELPQALPSPFGAKWGSFAPPGDGCWVSGLGVGTGAGGTGGASQAGWWDLAPPASPASLPAPGVSPLCGAVGRSGQALVTGATSGSVRGGRPWQ